MALEGLGRVHVADERDAKYPMQAVVPAKTARTFRYWNANRWWGDQQGTPKCVPYSWAHWAERPSNMITPWRSNGGHVYDRNQRKYVFAGQRPVFDIDAGYDWMQLNDYWPGTDYDGTSVRAGAQYLQRQGLISNYYWGYDVGTVIRAVLEQGPVVLGTAWRMDMFTPRLSDGMISATGEDAGGHAYLLDGVNTTHRFFRIKNSWGRNWGRYGFARISFDDVQDLIDDYGEACIATQ
jgi:hypothetical protein